MNFLETVPYIVVPLICMGIGVSFSLLNKTSLKKRIDTQSKIKAEARESHQREDHNRRLVEGSESSFLWQCKKIDESVLRMLLLKMERREKDV